MIIRSAAQRRQTVPLPRPPLLSAVAGDLSSVAPGNNLVQQVPPEGFSRPPDKSPWLTLPAPGINPWENARTSQTPKVMENIHIPFWQVLSKHGVPERSGLPESPRAAAMQPTGAQAGVSQPGSLIPRRRTVSKYPAQEEEKTLAYLDKRGHSKFSSRKRQESAGLAEALVSGGVLHPEGELQAAGGRAARGAAAGAAEPSPAQSLYSLAGWNCLLRSSSFKTGQNPVCSSSKHPRRVTVGLPTPRDGLLPPRADDGLGRGCHLWSRRLFFFFL